MIPRLKEQYNNELKTKIMSNLQLKNINEITLNCNKDNIPFNKEYKSIIIINENNLLFVISDNDQIYLIIYNYL